MSPRAGAAAGSAAAVLWVALCARWFDVGLARPWWLAAVPPGPLAAAAALLLVLCWRAHGPRLSGSSAGSPWPLLLVVGLAVLFRLPLVWQGAAAYVTADGALSGLVALHVRDGTERLVFVPHVPYSGSLKSHLTAPLSLAMDAARAFALSSVLFYALFVGALYRLALHLREAPAWTAPAAGLYAAFAPALVTRYSLSNDGNYVEVLALGTLALVLGIRWVRERERRGSLAVLLGLVLGVAFWCHILAVIYAAALGSFLLLSDWRGALRSAFAGSFGFALGAAPSLLWNAANGWASFHYLLPGGTPVGEAATGLPLPARLFGLVADHAPVLLGYDPGYPRTIDALLKAASFATLALAVAGLAALARRAARARCEAARLLLVLVVVNVAVALWALPYIPGNPRYLLFLVAPVAVALALRLRAPRARPVFAVVVALGALGSLAQFPGAVATDTRWRGFVGDLEREGVRWCYTDFYLGTKVNFLSEERVVCSSKLGPTTTEYFFAYREQVERAPAAAYIAVNEDNAQKLGRRLARLGVTCDRLDSMKPVLLRLSRKVNPAELFPDRDFPWR
ncbi:MAG TPA: hypothetical protein VMT87_00675 [Vicinamibacteria bacterium]|nr:hypothetical protein [Vicinamibacteria bacterium]